ncbi:MAG: sigma-70 family RNA polymerase sigma factor [Planctomycetota bacterium]
MDRRDSELLIRLREGDESAFDRIVERYERRLIGYFFSFSGDRHLSEDCAQEVFIRLYRARESYSPDAALATFLFRIAKNYWIDVYRSRKVRPEERALDDRAEESDAEPAGPSLGKRLAAEDEQPGERLSHEEDLAQLQVAMAQLPQIQQSVLALAGGQGMKYEQVAEVLGIPIGTVKSRVHAAVQNLRRLMGSGESEAPE